jgi:hypothetical protein
MRLAEMSFSFSQPRVAYTKEDVDIHDVPSGNQSDNRREMTRKQNSKYFWRDDDCCNLFLAADGVGKFRSKRVELN